MIHYQLRCGAGHGFEGWFRDSAAYERQAEDGEISCPVCQDTSIDRAPMAPRVMKSDGAGGTRRVPTEADAKQMLRALRRAVETHCENVGDRFAEEVRAIHNGDAEPRGIYGDTTPEEAEALVEDGIDFAKIPWIPSTDS